MTKHHGPCCRDKCKLLWLFAMILVLIITIVICTACWGCAAPRPFPLEEGYIGHLGAGDELGHELLVYSLAERHGVAD